MANNRSFALNATSRQLVVLVGLPFWASAGAIRILNHGLNAERSASGSTIPLGALLTEHLIIAAVAILLYTLANGIAWRRDRRLAAVLQHGVLLTAFVSCVPPILLASQSAPQFRFAAALDYFVTYLLGLAVILGVRSRLALRDAELARAALQQTAARAHLYALRMQMNPHFAFNTLNSIAALLDRDPPRARALLYAMSGLFQRTLSASHHEWHTVAEELQIANDYLEIQSERAEQRIAYELLVDPDTAQTRIPSLLLQPLVENAVLHGVQDDRDRLRVWVRAWRLGTDPRALRLCIEVGNSVNTPIHARMGQHGLGLGNTLQRLESAYGESASLRCTSPDVGTYVVNLEIPAAA